MVAGSFATTFHGVARSTRQLRDVAGIVAIRGESLDLAYIEGWVHALTLEAEWARVRAGDVT